MGDGNLEIEEMVGAYPTCKACGSRDVVRDAWAVWNCGSGTWVLKATFDHFACETCEVCETNVARGACVAETSLEWHVDKAFRQKRIRRLNDALRRGEGSNASVMITQGVQALGDEALPKITTALAAYSDFSEDNDPHGEHDFGALTVLGEKLFWKVDYFDKTLKMLSPDPASPVHTRRVLTIMLASEY